MFENYRVFKTMFAGRELTVETGKVCGLANGSCWVRYGETVVMVTLDCGEETTYAADTRTEKTSEDTRSSAASQRTLAGAQPVVQSVQAPQVRGVAVLCQGGGNAGTQRRITELVSALTGVGASHITVNKMQS